MRLENAGSTIDIDARLRTEFSRLPARVRLHGNEALCTLAAALIGQHAPHVAMAHDGLPVRCMSLEEWASTHLAALLGQNVDLADLALFSSIPEAALVEIARKRGIAYAPGAHDDVRHMLDRIAKEQPQTYLSLARGADRLEEAFAALRKSSEK